MIVEPGKSKRVGKYELLELVGKGAQGRVFKAIYIGERGATLSHGQTVALKEIRLPSDEEEKSRDRIIHRFHLLKTLRHESIVTYHDCFSEAIDEWDEAVYIVMDYVEGLDLKAILKAHPEGMPWDRAQSIFLQCIDALGYARDHGVIHRDIKPSNILIDSDDKPTLIDFDIAFRLDGTHSTTTGFRGSFDYMAPEFDPNQLPYEGFRGDQQSDLFSLAVCMYQALTGKLPYEAVKDGGALAFIHRSRSPGSFKFSRKSDVFKLISGLKRLLSRGITLNREERWASYEEMREALSNADYRILRHRDTRYRLTAVIGRGGFGTVYKAERVHDELPVAIKHLRMRSQSRRFIREARLLRDLRNPYLVQFVDYLEYQEQEYFLVMEYLPGDTLAGRIKREKSLNLAQAVVLFRNYLLGLQCLHDEGIYHRDIKPSNLFAPAGNEAGAKIMDLGIARDEEGTQTDGQVPGTLEYMAPDFVLDSSSRGNAGTDLFSLGLCFYEAVTGEHAFGRLPRTMNEAFNAYSERSRNPPEIDYTRPPLDGEPRLQAILKRALTADPSDRFHSAREMLDELERYRQYGNRIERDGAENETALTQFTEEEICFPVAASAGESLGKGQTGAAGDETRMAEMPSEPAEETAPPPGEFPETRLVSHSGGTEPAMPVGIEGSGRDARRWLWVSIGPLGLAAALLLIFFAFRKQTPIPVEPPPEPSDRRELADRRLPEQDVIDHDNIALPPVPLMTLVSFADDAIVCSVERDGNWMNLPAQGMNLSNGFHRFRFDRPDYTSREELVFIPEQPRFPLTAPPLKRAAHLERLFEVETAHKAGDYQRLGELASAIENDRYQDPAHTARQQTLLEETASLKETINSSLRALTDSYPAIESSGDLFDLRDRLAKFEATTPYQTLFSEAQQHVRNLQDVAESFLSEALAIEDATARSRQIAALEPIFQTEDLSPLVSDTTFRRFRRQYHELCRAETLARYQMLEEQYGSLDSSNELLALRDGLQHAQKPPSDALYDDEVDIILARFRREGEGFIESRLNVDPLASREDRLEDVAVLFSEESLDPLIEDARFQDWKAQYSRQARTTWVELRNESGSSCRLTGLADVERLSTGGIRRLPFSADRTIRIRCEGGVGEVAQTYTIARGSPRGVVLTIPPFDLAPVIARKPATVDHVTPPIRLSVELEPGSEVFRDVPESISVKPSLYRLKAERSDYEPRMIQATVPRGAEDWEWPVPEEASWKPGNALRRLEELAVAMDEGHDRIINEVFADRPDLDYAGFRDRLATLESRWYEQWRVRIARETSRLEAKRRMQFQAFYAEYTAAVAEQYGLDDPSAPYDPLARDSRPRRVKEPPLDPLTSSLPEIPSLVMERHADLYRQMAEFLEPPLLDEWTRSLESMWKTIREAWRTGVSFPVDVTEQVKRQVQRRNHVDTYHLRNALYAAYLCRSQTAAWIGNDRMKIQNPGSHQRTLENYQRKLRRAEENVRTILDLASRDAIRETISFLDDEQSGMVDRRASRAIRETWLPSRMEESRVARGTAPEIQTAERTQRNTFR